jgi:hypothetical protein
VKLPRGFPKSENPKALEMQPMISFCLKTENVPRFRDVLEASFVGFHVARRYFITASAITGLLHRKRKKLPSFGSLVRVLS